MPSAMDTAVLLQEVSAFHRLTTPQLLALAELLQDQKLAQGERLFRAGDEGSGIYLVVDGVIELRRGELVVERVGAGSFFGVLATLDGLPRSTDAVAADAARLLRLDREDLLSLADEVPGLGFALAQTLSTRVRRLEDRLEEAVSREARSDG